MKTFDPHVTHIALRQEFRNLLKLKGWKRKDLARVSGIEAVTISYILNNKQLLMLHQLDAITQAFGLPAGSFYSSFLAECCNQEGHIRPQKCGEFILRCLELEKENVIEDFLALVLQDKEVSRQTTILLDIAEHIYASPLRAKALPYYEQMMKRENKISERYAICRYRCFLILREQGHNPKLIEALHQFTPHLHRLPTSLQREAYRSVLVYDNLTEQWGTLLGYAEEMEAVVRESSQSKETNDADDAIHLAEALHYQAIALRGLGRLEEALAKTNEYASLHPDYAKVAESYRRLLTIQMTDRDQLHHTTRFLNIQSN